MTLSRSNRFDDFFAEDTYVFLKNLLYNYLLRKRAIRKCRQGPHGDLILEVGSGVSPMVTDSDRIVYSELSLPALRMLKKCQGRGFFVVAAATHLPFKESSFAEVVCSEVLEHLPEDRPALREMARVLKTGGSLILTFPHRRRYFAIDDRFVSHFRRYELTEMEEHLREAGLNPVEIRKVLGPLEKLTMVAVVSVVTVLQCLADKREVREKAMTWRFIRFLFKWCNRLYCVPIWLDARISPRSLAAVILIRSVK
ncbi:MAG: class I SAM-dependent methyltransferase [Deltaproteobacteria bacterium]|nr:class I SAM-dependent methyltransferase [Deltaproteobacteria bacterium]